MISTITTDQAKLVSGDILKLPCTVNYSYCDNTEKTVCAVKAIIEFLSGKPSNKYALDIETSGLDPYLDDIICLQVGLDNNIQYIFDGRLVDLALLTPLFKLDCWKIGHNLKFDAKFIKHKLGASLTKMFDTFLAEKVLRGGTYFGGEGYSLDVVISKRLGRELTILANDFRANYTDKIKTAKKYMQQSFIELRGKYTPLSEAQLAYAAQDVAAGTIIELAVAQKKELCIPSINTIWDRSVETCSLVNKAYLDIYNKICPKELTLWPTALLEFKFLEVVVDMELAGIKFSKEIHDEVMNNIDKDYIEYRKEFLKLLGETVKQKTLFGTAAVNPDSNKQVLHALNNLGLNIEDTSEDTLENTIRTVDKSTKAHRIVENLLGHRKAAKLKTTYGEKLDRFIHSKTGRIHVDVNQIIETGRISNSKPNCQQIPLKIEWKKSGNKEEDEKVDKRKGFRDCFIPEIGNKFIIYDYSAQELRVAASISLDPLMLSAFKQNKDLHSFSASLMYQEDYDTFVEAIRAGRKDMKDKRQHAKTVSFGSLYGSGPANLAEKLHISLDEAKDILARYWEAYPDLAQAMARYGNTATKLGYSNTVLGRKRFYTDLIQKIKWIRNEFSFKAVERMVEEAKMFWLLEEGPITEENMEYAKSKLIKKYSSEISRKAGNHHIQGTSADMLKMAAVLIRKDIIQKQIDATIVGLIHDEILIEVKEQQSEECKNIVELNMKKAMNMLCPNVPAEVEGCIANAWKK